MNRTVVLGALCAALATGCSDEYAGRMPVSGKVTLEGRPLSDATITFEPLDGQDTASGAAVEDGVYKVERKAGLKPGKYVVRITAGDGVTPANEEEGGNPGGNTNILSRDRIPADYSESSKQQIEVKSDGPNTFDFSIPKAREHKKGRR